MYAYAILNPKVLYIPEEGAALITCMSTNTSIWYYNSTMPLPEGVVRIGNDIIIPSVNSFTEGYYNCEGINFNNIPLKMTAIVYKTDSKLVYLNE